MHYLVYQENNLSSKYFLTGSEEADAFQDKRFIALHQSTLKKVHVFEHIYDLALNNRLKTNSTWKSQYGISFQGIYEYGSSKAWVIMLWNFILLILGGLIGGLFI